VALVPNLAPPRLPMGPAPCRRASIGPRRLLGAVCVLGVLPLCRADGRGDVSALVQTAIGAHTGIAEKKGEKEAVETFMTGDKAEVITLSGPNIGTWVPCVVLRKDAGDTYTIHVPEAPAGQQDMPNIPAQALRRAPVEVHLDRNASDGVLLFWAVGSKDYMMDLVMQNIDHLRETYEGPVDVYLAHYDGQQDAWLNRDETWYKENVQFSGLKSWKVKKSSGSRLRFPPQVFLAQEFLPEVLSKKHYRWIWLLDEDVDFRQTDVKQLLEDAGKTKALIVAPSVTLGNRTGEGVDDVQHSECLPKYAACQVHASNPSCTYRYVNFVDMSFPLMHPVALVEAYKACNNCMHQLDRIWCSRTARQLNFPKAETCAILDKVSVVHSNSRALKTTSAAANLLADTGDALKLYKDDFVTGEDVATLKCVQ